MKQAPTVKGFTYGLAPVLTRGYWQTDQLGRALAVAHAEIDAIEVRRAQAQAVYEDQLEAMRHTGLRTWYAPVQGMHFELLARQQALLDALATEDEQARNRKQVLLRQTIQAQQRVEALEQHRGSQLEDYLRQRQQQLQAEQDREWLARTTWNRQR